MSLFSSYNPQNSNSLSQIKTSNIHEYTESVWKDLPHRTVYTAEKRGVEIGPECEQLPVLPMRPDWTYPVWNQTSYIIT